jgi:hypothetical protein
MCFARDVLRYVMGFGGSTFNVKLHLGWRSMF